MDSFKSLEESRLEQQPIPRFQHKRHVCEHLLQIQNSVPASLSRNLISNVANTAGDKTVLAKQQQGVLKLVQTT